MSNHPKVIDMDGNERDWSYAEEKYGVAYRRGEPNEDGEIYHLIVLVEKTGHSSLITQVLDENGQPIDQMDVAFYWPDAPDPPDPPTTLLAHDWHPNFTHGKTNLNGDVGPGMGHGAYHGEGEGGPHAVWVRDPDVPSDICEKLGMLAGTFHDHFDQKFQLLTGDVDTRWFYEVEDREEEPGDDNHIVIVALDDANFYDTRLSLVVGDDPGDPDWEAPGPIYPVNLKTYEVETNYVPTEGEEGRTFWARIDTPSGTPLSDWLPFEFETGVHKTITAYVSYEEDDDDDNGNGDGNGELWKLIEDGRTPKPGMRLLVGHFPEAGITFYVDGIKMLSGSKPEYGSGGFEFVFWQGGNHNVDVDNQRFYINANDNEIIRCHFEKGGGGEPSAWLVSSKLRLSEAEDLLEELEADGYDGIFTIVEE
jgi:hypothetical protein